MTTPATYQLLRQLQTIGDSIVKRACRSAISKAATVVARQIRASAPDAKTPGHSSKGLKQSVGSRVVKGSPAGIVEAKAGIEVGKPAARRIGKGERVYHLMVMGTADRWTGSKRSGRYRKERTSTGNKRMFRGRMPGDQFVTKAFRIAQAAAYAAMERSLAQSIEKEAAK